MKSILLPLLISILGLPASKAALEIVVEEVVVSYGTDVRISWSGSLNTAGVSWAIASGTSVSGGVNPASGALLGYDASGSTITLSQVGMLSPGTIAFGTGSLTHSNLFSGSPFGLDGAGRIGVPAGYASGSSLEGSIRFSNQNFNSLGIDPESGPAVWTLPSGDTITLDAVDEVVVTVDFESIGTSGEVVPPITNGDLTVTITDFPGDDQEPRIAEYGDAQFYGFAGNSPGVSADPSKTSPSHYLCSARTNGGPFAFTTMEFAFSSPVKSFRLSTIDMTESVYEVTPLIVTALSADGTTLAQTIVKNPSDKSNGAVFTFGVATSGNDIHKIRFEGPATGHGIDDLVITRNEGSPPPHPPSPITVISPPTGWNSVFVDDMSNDGTKIVGRLFRSSDFTYQCFLWSEEDGYTLLDGLPGTNADSIAGISGDGNIVLGWTPSDSDANEDRSWIYRSGTTTAIPWIGGTEYNFARALSPDGSVLVGKCDINLTPTTFADRPAIWTWNGSSYIGSVLSNTWPAVTEFQNLGWLEVTSGDGRYVYGKHAVSSFPATYNSYRFDLVDGSIDNLNFPTNLNIVQSNNDGSLVLLYRDRSYAYLWEPGTGLEQLSNRPAEGLTGYSYRAIGMSENAERILAYEDRFALGSLLGTLVVIWDENRERLNFLETVEAQGIDLTGWSINEINAISSDGTIIAGGALVDEARVGFLLTLPEGPLSFNPVDALLTGPDGFFDPDDGPEITAFDADPDKDGIPNIVEISLASLDGETINPCNPSNPSSHPTTTLEINDPAVPSIDLTVIRRRNIPGLTVRMAFSSNIEDDWSSDGVTETVIPIDDTWEKVTFSAPTGGERQFVRLMVNYIE